MQNVVTAPVGRRLNEIWRENNHNEASFHPKEKERETGQLRGVRGRRGGKVASRTQCSREGREGAKLLCESQATTSPSA